MRGWATKCLVIVACLSLAVPALAAGGENVWSKYNMKLWGRVKVDYNYDDVQFAKYNDFIGAVADSKEHTDWDNDSTNFNPRDTRFGWASSHQAGDWLAKAVFEMDFYGTNAGNNLIPRMRLGYVDLVNKAWGTSLRFGQDWIPISRLNPSTIDFGILTAAGNLWWRVPQITVRQKVAAVPGLELLASVMRHRRTSTAGETRMPWVLARVAYSFEAMGAKSMVALGGGYQADQLGDSTKLSSGATLVTKGANIDRYLACFELKTSYGPFLLKGEAWYGMGLGAHWLRYNEDLFVSNDLKHIQEVEARGGWVDLTYKILPEWSLTAGWGIDDPKDTDYNRVTIDGYSLDRMFTRNMQTYVNTWYSLMKGVKVGAEWINVQARRKDANGHHYTDLGNRFTVSMFYVF